MKRQHRWRLCVRGHFAAAHALRHYQGKCEQMHGHNFAVELSMEGHALSPETGIMLDFHILKTVLDDILAELDHTCLNERAPFDKINPSSENLSRYIWEQAAAWLARNPDLQASGGLALASVTVAEGDRQSATYQCWTEG